MGRIDSISLLIKEINDCLNNDNSLAALYIALSLPDVCAKIMKSDTKRQQDRYKEWFDKYVSGYITGKIGEEKYNMLNFSADDCYKLRCCLYHEGNYDIEDETLDKFVLTFGKSAILANSSSRTEICDDVNGNKIEKKTHIRKNVNVPYICQIIVLGVNDFLKEKYISEIKLPTFKTQDIPAIFKARTLKDLCKDDDE